MVSKLFPNRAGPRSIDLTVFCDERKIESDKGGEGWWYICMLLVPSVSVPDVISELLTIRKCHDFYGEMSFHRIRSRSTSSTRTAVAIDWLRFLKAHTGLHIYWEVLGLATHNLDFSCFGPGEEPTGKYATVQNRFFRTAFTFSVNRFFRSYDRVTISNVYHDSEGHLQRHRYFDRHLPTVVADERIRFGADRITFVFSDHEKEHAHKAEAQMIQLADILIGSVSQRLDECSRKKGKVELGDCMTDMLYTAATNQWQANEKGYDVSFFPKERSSLQDIENALTGTTEFFRREPREYGQSSLPWA